MNRMLSLRGAAYVVFALALLAAVTMPIAASSDSAQRLYLGMNLHFTGPDTSAGTFVASGAVVDSGTVTVEQLAIAPIGNRDQGTLSGLETYAGQQGTIVTRFEGNAFPLSSPHEVGLGHFEVVSGTGAYVRLSGHGTFQIVVDATTNQLIGTETATVAETFQQTGLAANRMEAGVHAPAAIDKQNGKT
jgi:hypothetical protein